MPLWGYDKNDQLIATWDAGYPAPQDMIDRIKAGTENLARIEDIPPLTPEFYHAPKGAGVAEPKPVLELALSTTSVQADGSDPVVITGVPAGSSVSVVGPESGNFVQEADEPFHLVFSEPGTYEVRAYPPGHRPAIAKLQVTEATGTKRKARKRKPPTEFMVHVGQTGEMAAEQAEADADLFFDSVMARHGRFLPMLAEAEAHLAGKPSKRVQQLAVAQGSTPDLVAQAIIESGNTYWDAEAKRAAAKREFREIARKGGRKADIAAAAKRHGFDIGAAHRPLNAAIAVSKTSGGQA